jgi:hypothetical protein
MPKITQKNRKDKLVVKVSDLMTQAILSDRKSEVLFEEVPEGDPQATCDALVQNLKKWEGRRYNFELAQLFLLGQLIAQQSFKEGDLVFDFDDSTVRVARFLFAVFQESPYAIHYLEDITQRLLKGLTGDQKVEIHNRVLCRTSYKTR